METKLRVGLEIAAAIPPQTVVRDSVRVLFQVGLGNRTSGSPSVAIFVEKRNGMGGRRWEVGGGGGGGGGG